MIFFIHLLFVCLFFLGHISLVVKSPPGKGELEPRSSAIRLPLKVKVIPTPPRQ